MRRTCELFSVDRAT